MSDNDSIIVKIDGKEYYASESLYEAVQRNTMWIKVLTVVLLLLCVLLTSIGIMKLDVIVAILRGIM